MKNPVIQRPSQRTLWLAAFTAYSSPNREISGQVRRTHPWAGYVIGCNPDPEYSVN